MTEYFLVDDNGHINNVVSGDNLTREQAITALLPTLREKVTLFVTTEQLVEYEARKPR